MVFVLSIKENDESFKFKVKFIYLLLISTFELKLIVSSKDNRFVQFKNDFPQTLITQFLFSHKMISLQDNDDHKTTIKKNIENLKLNSMKHKFFSVY